MNEEFMLWFTAVCLIAVGGVVASWWRKFHD